MSAQPDWSADLNRARREDLEWMARWGETFDGAARRLGISPSALDKWLDRHAPDLKTRLRLNERAAS